MWLRRKSEEKLAQEAAVQAEIDRLKALSTEELAVILLPALGPDGPAPGQRLRPQQLCEYLLREFPGGGQTRPLQLLPPVRRATTKLEDAGLVSAIYLQRSPVWGITSLGARVLADATVEQRLGNPA
ncbi:MAG: hypothetical protein WBQ18_13860 [Solirubrobacteraceae bacterium]